jgi:hypothetical protein
VQRCQFIGSSGRATGLNEPLSSRPVGSTASYERFYTARHQQHDQLTALLHMNASTLRGTSSATEGCTLLPFLSVSSLDDSTAEAFD